MKNKKRCILLIILYILGYLYFCIYGGINYGMKVSDYPTLDIMILFSNIPIPVGARNLSITIFIWIIISFFLVLFILWQTNLDKQKLNRTVLVCQGINLLLTCLSRGIVEWIVGGTISGVITILIVLLVLVGVSIGITCFVQKKNGKLNSYEVYADIMTEDEFEQWQNRKNKQKKK